MRYAIITDVHANYAALEAVDQDVRALRELDMSRSIAYWFLGDLVGYGPRPVECIRWLKETARIDGRWVPGNHDEYLVRRDPNVTGDAKASLGRHEEILGETENRELHEWFTDEVRRATELIDGGNEEVRSLVIERHGELTAVFVHGSVSSMGRRDTYLTPWNEKNLVSAEFGLLEEMVDKSMGPVVLFCGHTHYPMWVRPGDDGRPRLQSIRYFRPFPLGEGLMIINPGSVGQPRDGDTRAAYLIFDTVARTVEFRRVVYPIQEALEDLRGDWAYPQTLADRLETADGMAELQLFNSVYQRPKWDLEAVE
jgi:diadenosine tetraphosphatase ApaH/serine/threonine PP2A family protein phosphatase